jgi:hypothetical protein
MSESLCSVHHLGHRLHYTPHPVITLSGPLYLLPDPRLTYTVLALSSRLTFCAALQIGLDLCPAGLACTIALPIWRAVLKL